ncbi:hypothetical protein HG535_0F00340 [Zygotorulaspora mrakii]|uniref:General transcriptional corepressor TUP1 n=1 Tax=Zygotorulaspora mrakii TaxID=42260 RepID=A0A7H9B587_ZYGMR|nr:uncharacterized protein HG535_0F00340 [Zygotorulaspora mrakii]QLG73524.1 hypothetical protein HG535_0F00340 [Zygotorulaspora mrakii]
MPHYSFYAIIAVLKPIYKILYKIGKKQLNLSHSICFFSTGNRSKGHRVNQAKMSSIVASSQTKLNELLEAIRLEFAQVSQEATSYRLQNQKDYDFKINQQLAEMQQIRNTVYELELTHRKMKDAYEEEINRLKIELEQRDRRLASFTVHHQQQAQQQQQHQLLHQQQAQQQQVQTAAPNTTVSGPSSFAAGSPASGTAGSQMPPQPTLPAVAATSNQSPSLAPAPAASTTAAPSTPGFSGSAAPAQTPAPSGTGNESQAQTTLQKAGTSILPSTSPLPQQEQLAKITKAEVTSKEMQKTQSKQTGSEGGDLPQEHYVVPYADRASHAKPIPPFLLDLDSQTVPSHLKKQTNDYFVLYNPALPRELDVELHCSLDHTSVVCCVRFSNDGEFLATGCNKTTQVFKVSDGTLVARLSDDAATQINEQNDDNGNGEETNNDANFAASKSASTDLYIRSVCFSPDGKFLATGAEDRLIRIWDIAQKKIVMVLQGHEQDIYSLDYFPSGDKLVSGSGDRTVRIWDLRTGQCSLTLSIEDGVTTVAVSPGDGKFIAAGSLDRAVRVWDSETGFLVERLDSENESGTGHKDSVYSVVFTRDGNGVVSGSLDRSVKLWNLRSGSNDSNTNGKPTPGTCEVTYTGHKDFVLSVATTQNDEYILSGSKDRGVLFWDTVTGNPLLMLQGHRNSVISVAVANSFPLGPQYGVFATGSGDCKARIWKYTKKENGTEGDVNQPKVKELKE